MHINSFFKKGNEFKRPSFSFSFFFFLSFILYIYITNKNNHNNMGKKKVKRNSHVSLPLPGTENNESPTSPKSPVVASSSSTSSPSWWEKVNQWYNPDKGERTPLLINEDKTTKKRRFRCDIKYLIFLLWLLAIFFMCLIVNRFWYKIIDDPKQQLITDPEKLLLSLPKAENTREYLKKYTSEAHVAGTESDLNQAKWTLDKFKEFGLIDSHIETYYPMVNYPISHRLAMVSGPKKFRYEAKLREDPILEDESTLNPDVVPAFHGFSKNGTVKGQVVYANYGSLKDFQYLVDNGVNLNGTIALVRYGTAVRGLKLRAASKFGCIGALIYSDPIDDGPLGKDQPGHENPAKSYPDGPWRTPSSVQRGSVSYISLGAGDPLTPGYAATKDAPRIKPEESDVLTDIPSLPLSWEDALPLLKATQGHGVTKDNDDWKGGFVEVDYYSGPTLGEVELTNHIENKITPIWNVIGRINGTEEPDHAIIFGNHRDAWVYGAVDPSSGSAVLLEIVRTFGELLKTGWKPRRTIIFASWDGEEYGFLGSTEWVENHRDWLKKEGSVYVNLDVAVAGPHFGALASPSLKQILFEVTQNIDDPRTGEPIFEDWVRTTNPTVSELEINQGTKKHKNHHSKKKKEYTIYPKVEALGSGSDFVAFLDHIGIASIDLGFAGDYGVYHSNYDSFHWMEKFGDPNFEYHATAAKVIGNLVFRLATDRILPLHPYDYTKDLKTYIQDIEIYAGQGNQNFTELKNALEILIESTQSFENDLLELKKELKIYDEQQEKENVKDKDNHIIPNKDIDLPTELYSKLKKANHRLSFFERGFIDEEEGIPSRPWFKHIVFAPSLWEGYASQTFPAIMEAINDQKCDELTLAIQQAIQCFEEAKAILNDDYY
ncbi:unnamed protein product [Cunninghamella blakesleeana]